MSLGASDRTVAILGSIYWFTVEFGLIKENGQMKFYGGGVASSVSEIENFLVCKDMRQLNIQKELPPVNFIIENIQPFFYYIERSFTFLYNILYKFYYYKYNLVIL